MNNTEHSGSTAQGDIDQKNADFWNELCGSLMAKELGIVDDSPKSLKLFDDWYFEFYPYLRKYIPFSELEGQRVLEVGLGYGSVAQKIFSENAHYHGLDIALGPVESARKRCVQHGLQPNQFDIRQGSILEPPFSDSYFDWIVAIGCLHHTGNLAKAIQNTYRLLKPNGRATIMVYSSHSYRQFALAPLRALQRAMTSKRAVDSKSPDDNKSKEFTRFTYDGNLDGEAAPETEFVSRHELREMCSDFSEIKITSENIGAEGPLRFLPRSLLCKSFGPVLGLDLYCELKK